MRWDYLFNKQILSRGRQYFQGGCVKELMHRGATYQAKVLGTEIYHVEVYLSDRVHPKMYCDCPYAEDGYACKHMAAVLYAIEESEKQEAGNGTRTQKGDSINGGKKLPKRVFPFAGAEETEAGEGESARLPAETSRVMTDDYEYFDMEEMTKNFVFYEDVLQAAKSMIEDGTLQLGKLEVGYPNRLGANELMCNAYGVFQPKQAGKNNETHQIVVSFDKTGVKYVNCTTPDCYYNYHAQNNRYYYGLTRPEAQTEMCVHALGLLLLVQKKLMDEAIGDATDSYAQRMLMDFRNLRAGRNAEENSENSERILLEPFLEQLNEGLQVGFKIGTDKLYVVKNLPELVHQAENKKKLELGTKAELDFAYAKFTEPSEKYYRFIRQVVLEEQSREEYARESYRYYESISETIKGKIPLYGKRLDAFFDIGNGGQFSYTEKVGYQKTKGVLRLREADPEIEFTVSQEQDERGVFQGVRIKGKVPEFISGMEYQYFLDGNYLNRVNLEKMRQLQPILDMAEGNQISMQVGRRYLSEFYYRVLPILKENVTVKEQNIKTIQKYLPPEVEFVFYLDAEEKNITCQAKAKYGDVECDVLDWLQRNAKKDRFRDVERESEVLEVVRQIFQEIDWEKKLFHCASDADRMYDALESGVSELMKLGEVQTTDRFRRMRIRKSLPVTVGVSLGSDILNLEIGSEELTQEELLDILYQYRKKKKFYRLKNGDFINLEEQSLEELSDMLEAMHVSPKEFVKGKMQLPLYRALYLDKMLEQCDGIYSNRDSHFKKLVKNFKTVEDSDFELPKSLQPVLRKYQKHGYRWLRTLENCGFGGILADDMGLGKTLQVIAVLLAAKQERETGGENKADSVNAAVTDGGHEANGMKESREKQPALIVTPASLVYNWQEEFAQFAPELSVGVVAGNQTQRQEMLAAYQNWDVLVTSYDLLKRDIAEYEGKKFSYQVIDEAQYIKNHSTAAAKSVKIIQSRVKYALTGTPIENRLSELWSIFDYLMPGFLYGYDTFKKEFESPIVKNKDADATRQLKRMVSPFILRRLKGDVLKDLPEKLEEVCYAKMEEKQQHLYDGQLVHMRTMLEKQTDENYKKNKLQILAEITKLRQICCDPSLFVENFDGESAKRQTCMELIQSAIEGEHKILLFSQFTSMLELLEKDLKEQKISYYKITGETAKEKRVELVRRFNEDDTPLFLISLKAGGTGLNLTGADIVIHYDPWWNLAVQNQATDRAHRIGQTKAVSVYKLIVKNSIEEKILHMQEQKKNLADEILSGENGGIVNMSREELLELLG